MEELIKLHYRTKNPSRGDITTEGILLLLS